MLRSKLGSPYFGKLPYSSYTTVAGSVPSCEDSSAMSDALMGSVSLADRPLPHSKPQRMALQHSMLQCRGIEGFAIPPIALHTL